MTADGTGGPGTGRSVPSSLGQAGHRGAPDRPVGEPDAGAPWPTYDAGLDFSDSADHLPTLRRRRRVWPFAAAAVSTAVLAAGWLSTTTPGPAPQPAPQPPLPLPVGPQWESVDSSLTAGLVRVQVTATIEADGIVMTEDGLVATSYARIAGFADPAGYVEAIELNVVADGGMPMRAEIVGFDVARDVAVLRVPGYQPASVAKPGTDVAEGDDLTLLDDLGEGAPVVGYPVTVDAIGQQCFRSGAAMIGRPKGFGFAVNEATAEPGGAVVRSDGTVVGLYHGGDGAGEGHCAIPIAEVTEIVGNVARGRQTATTRVGDPGGLDVQLFALDDPYPEVISLGGYASEVGIQLGDQLVRVGETSLHADDLTTIGPDGVIRLLEPGERVAIEWRSAGITRQAEVEVRIGAQPRG